MLIFNYWTSTLKMNNMREICCDVKKECECLPVQLDQFALAGTCGWGLHILVLPYQLWPSSHTLMAQWSPRLPWTAHTTVESGFTNAINLDVGITALFMFSFFSLDSENFLWFKIKTLIFISRGLPLNVWELQCIWKVFTAKHFLGFHDLACALTSTVNCGTFNRQVCVFWNKYQSTVFTLLKLSCRNFQDDYWKQDALELNFECHGKFCEYLTYFIV